VNIAACSVLLVQQRFNRETHATTLEPTNVCPRWYWGRRSDSSFQSTLLSTNQGTDKVIINIEGATRE